MSVPIPVSTIGGLILILEDMGLCDEDFELLLREDCEQIKKWGLQKHHVFEWLAYITEEVGELSNAISEYVYRGGHLNDIIKEATQAATLSLKVAVMAKRMRDYVRGTEDSA